MKKNILFIILILLLCGCSATYNLEIKDDNYNEEIVTSIPIDQLSDYEELLDSSHYVKTTLNSSIVYKSSDESDDENKVTKYTHSYSFDEYQTSLNNKCFDNLKLDYDDNYYSLLGVGFNCFGEFDISADSYQINIKTDYNVLNNNADKVKGNTYTWNFNKDNYVGKTIVFQYSKAKVNPSITKTIIPVVISFVISILLIILFSIIYNVRNKKTEM